MLLPSTTFLDLDSLSRVLSIYKWIALLFLGVPLLWITINYVRVLRLRRRMPPGPFPLPIIGTVGRIPMSKPWITFERWAKEYDSPLITIWTGTTPTVIANDCWSASELMDRRANIYSSRPHMVLVGDMFDESTTNQTSLVYGDQWRTHRRIMHAAVGAQAVRAYRSFQGNESRVLALNILESPDDYVNSIERYSTSVVSIVGWGRRIQANNDYVLGIALSFVQNGAGFSSPGQFLTESYPWLCKLPAWIYPLPSILWKEGQRSLKYFYALSLEASLSKIDNFSKHLIKSQKQYGLSYKEVASLTGNLIGGGVDTTTTSTISFIFAMCLFPEVQRKAQEELDRVLPERDRFPTWTEENQLPYLDAIITENFRWRSAIVLGGPPHAPIKDDVYNGYLIPKGTTLIGNLWAIHRNPRDYPSPDEFRPERWLNEDERRPNPTKRGIFTFGWGRRACSGQPMAEQGIWFTCAELLWAFKMRAIDEHGNNVKLDPFAYDDRSTSRPLPFRVEFKPRFPGVEDIIRSEAKRALAELEMYNGETAVTMDNAEQFLK
ncbi:hypothetical protein Z517_03286 [Fonsecaea pedrosoi CBS 271.37]|uniref:Cytochrome P450 n=1 Tax=Fonsecaea pedrosoi CBS 271.37 TaxID=1442368 RepID=A0A0D2GZM2_9EURO|nr:uncharacterized protein Z517_03286 [Fonsecaea pedrosoi CBS 271.37]KIW84040.1 hypothetical protein Z517_03286 [Fonsecaea pedrosoi CBS 271.37]